MKKQTLLTVFIPALMLGLGACGSDSSTPDPNQQDQGKLTLSITDAPIDHAMHVVIEFTGVTVKPAVGNAIDFTFDTPRQIDVLALQGGLSEKLLDQVSLPEDDYESVILHVNAGMLAEDSYIDIDTGGRHALYLPEEYEGFLEAPVTMVFDANGNAAMTIDFDLRKSIIAGVGTEFYVLQPALRAVNNSEAGGLAGTVAVDLIDIMDCVPAVYVWEGQDAPMSDIGHPTGPLATGSVKYNDSANTFEYSIGFLPAGEYTVGLTCDAGRDTAEPQELVQFLETDWVTVTAGETLTMNF